MSDHQAPVIRQTAAWLNPTDCVAADLEALVLKSATAEYCEASSLEKGIPVYTCDQLRDGMRSPGYRRKVMAEWVDAMKSGPGVIVLRGAFDDPSVVDAVTDQFDAIIDEERSKHSGGDHFGKPGANDRVWNALEKLCLRNPSLFAAYYGNAILAMVSESWLGPAYQITSQNHMKPSSSRSFALICLAAALETSPVHAINLGISYASASGEMPAAFRTAIKQYTQEKERVNALVTDAQNDSLREMEGIQNFIAVKVDAMIVAPVDSMSTQKITSMAKKAGIPLVLLDASFNETGSLRRVSTVGAGENRPGVVQMREVCRLMGGSGNVVVLTEDPVKSAARERMQEVEEVVSKAPCDRIKIIDRRQGGANQLQSAEVVAGWLGRGRRINAVVAQSDELALGAIHALKKANQAANVVVAGIGATPAGLASVEAGDMTLTVFQDEVKQSRAAIDLAVQMANGTIAQSTHSVPASLVTRNNCAFYRQDLGASVVSRHP